jgi:hypothetical protein
MHLGINSDITKLDGSGEPAEAASNDNNAVDERLGRGVGSHDGARDRSSASGREEKRRGHSEHHTIETQMPPALRSLNTVI